jgi:uncharacterized membrane protein YphA (DoxX/SURF4 family)
MTTLATRPGRSARVANVATWAVQAVVGFMFVSAGLMKLSGDAVMVDLFTEIGAGQWLRFFVGACEVAGGVALVIPRLTGLAAAALGALMVGAIVTNVAIIDENPTPPLIYLAVLAVIAYRRRDRIAALITRRR